MNRGDCVAATTHDHQLCIERALAHAEVTCSERGLRLTAIRRHVLEMIWASHRPSKAYDLLETLDHQRGRTAPPTVYRALDFLLAAGLIHKIQSLNAFVGCGLGRPHGHPKFLICHCCNCVTEIPGPAVDEAIAIEAGQAGFRADGETIEIGGTCRACIHNDNAG